MDQPNEELPKVAFALWQQLEALASSMGGKPDPDAYVAYARSFNGCLDRGKELLAHDPALRRTIGDVERYDEIVTDDYERVGKMESLRADMAVLKGAAIAFFQYHCPPEEKARMGFSAEEP